MYRPLIYVDKLVILIRLAVREITKNGKLFDERPDLLEGFTQGELLMFVGELIEVQWKITDKHKKLDGDDGIVLLRKVFNRYPYITFAICETGAFPESLELRRVSFAIPAKREEI